VDRKRKKGDIGPFSCATEERKKGFFRKGGSTRSLAQEGEKRGTKSRYRIGGGGRGGLRQKETAGHKETPMVPGGGKEKYVVKRKVALSLTKQGRKDSCRGVPALEEREHGRGGQEEDCMKLFVNKTSELTFDRRINKRKGELEGRERKKDVTPLKGKKLKTLEFQSYQGGEGGSPFLQSREKSYCPGGARLEKREIYSRRGVSNAHEYCYSRTGHCPTWKKRKSDHLRGKATFHKKRRTFKA